MMGNYHFGHVKALLEEDALPHIMSGTSAGSAIASFLCTRNDEEIARDLKPEILCDKLLCFTRSWPERIFSYIRTGAMFDVDDWIERIKWFTMGDTTFEEAYRKTGRVFCITLSATTKRAPPVLVNHITAPNVVIASAIIASAAVPGFIHPVRLHVKDKDGTVRVQSKDQTWWDGSIEQDIPTAGLAEMVSIVVFSCFRLTETDNKVENILYLSDTFLSPSAHFPFLYRYFPNLAELSILCCCSMQSSYRSILLQ